MMKRVDWKVFLLLGIIVSVVVGFVYGTGILGGSSPNPGSREDPLASASYADGAIDQRVREMDTKINSLEAKILSLESKIAILTGEAADADEPASADPPSGDGAASSSGGASGGAGTAPAAGGGTVSQADIGKEANVTSQVVNLRETASTQSNIKKKLSPTDTFTITKVDIEKGWYQVQLSDGTSGWVAGYLVKIK